MFDAGSVGKWAHRVETLPTGRAEGARALLSFHPDDHADPLSDGRERVAVAWSVRDEELLLEALEDDPRFMSLGRDIGSDGWAFAWLGGDRDLRAVAPPDDDYGEGDEPIRVVVDRDLVTAHAVDQSVLADLAAHLGGELEDLVGRADHRRAA